MKKYNFAIIIIMTKKLSNITSNLLVIYSTISVNDLYINNEHALMMSLKNFYDKSLNYD